MRKYEFSFVDDDIVEGFPTNQEISIKFEAETMDQMVEAFRCLLAAAGYCQKNIEKYLDN